MPSLREFRLFDVPVLSLTGAVLFGGVTSGVAAELEPPASVTRAEVDAYLACKEDSSGSLSVAECDCVAEAVFVRSQEPDFVARLALPVEYEGVDVPPSVQTAAMARGRQMLRERLLADAEDGAVSACVAPGVAVNG